MRYKCCSLVERSPETQETVDSPLNTFQHFCTHQKRDMHMTLHILIECFKIVENQFLCVLCGCWKKLNVAAVIADGYAAAGR